MKFAKLKYFELVTLLVVLSAGKTGGLCLPSQAFRVARMDPRQVSNVHFEFRRIHGISTIGSNQIDTYECPHVVRQTRSLLSVHTSLSSQSDTHSTSSDSEGQRVSPSGTQVNQLDHLLERCTTAFPLFVLGAAVLALTRPSTLQWVNSGNLVTYMLALVMCGTGLTLTTDDFTRVLQVPSNRLAVPLGVACQFLIMPLTAYLVGRTLLLGLGSPVAQALFLGLVLVGCSPGGTASNLVSLIGGADVALSVILTSCSTLCAVVLTPILVKLLVGRHLVGATTSITISGLALCAATAKVVLLPVLTGMLLRARAPGLALTLSRFTPFVSVLLVSLLCGGVVAQTAPLLSSTGTGSMVGLPLVVGSVLLLHSIGFLVGYLIPKTLFPNKEKSARTISIEVGMQNSALAVVLARSIPGIHPAASLPGALSATAHSCLGSLLAAFWRLRGSTKGDDIESTPDL